MGEFLERETAYSTLPARVVVRILRHAVQRASALCGGQRTLLRVMRAHMTTSLPPP